MNFFFVIGPQTHSNGYLFEIDNFDEFLLKIELFDFLIETSFANRLTVSSLDQMLSTTHNSVQRLVINAKFWQTQSKSEIFHFCGAKQINTRKHENTENPWKSAEYHQKTTVDDDQGWTNSKSPKNLSLSLVYSPKKEAVTITWLKFGLSKFHPPRFHSVLKDYFVFS
jgi:hypothetical protein